jgi:phytoene desaturase
MDRVSAAVIGSGFGGLALAIRLQAAGCRTSIFEKRDQPGGRAYVYRDQGFTFDAGPTVITAPACLEELFTLAARSMADYVTLLPVHPFYRLFWEDGFSFDYSADLVSVERQIASKAPGDLRGFKSFLSYSEKVFEEGYVKLAHVPFLDWSSMAKVAPQLLQLKAYRSVHSMVAKFIQDLYLNSLFGTEMGRVFPQRRHRRTRSGNAEAV